MMRVSRLQPLSHPVKKHPIVRNTIGAFAVPCLIGLVLGLVAFSSGCGNDPTLAGLLGPTPDDTTDPEPEVVAEPDPEPKGPLGRVYLKDPITDGAPIEVELVPPTTEDGSLVSDYANAINCMNKDGGPSLGGFGNLCVEEKTVFPDEDGNYLHIEPPPGDDMEDAFAELMMYHHVNLVHDYFNGTHGFTDLDFPLDAVVNISMNIFGGWQTFPNAAFIPAQSFAAFGLPQRDFGAIMFGGGQGVDFSYDASVIYHEYTHAVVGTERLQGAFLDSQGMNNLPGALNEGLADYFASTMQESALLGGYALGAQMRNLTLTRTCPENLTTEIHADGKIIGSALWAAREELGADKTDSIAFGALMSSGLTTGLEAYGQLLLDESRDILDADEQNKLEEILVDHGVVGCERIRTWEPINFAQGEGVPHSVEGLGSLQGAMPANGLPGYFQWVVPEVGDGEVLRLSWTLSSGGGFPPQPASPLAIAVRAGEPIFISALTGGIAADGFPPAPPADNDVQTIELSGSCIPAGGGDVFVMFRNTEQSGSGVMSLGIERLAQTTGDVPISNCD